MLPRPLNIRNSSAWPIVRPSSVAAYYTHDSSGQYTGGDTTDCVHCADDWLDIFKFKNWRLNNCLLSHFQNGRNASWNACINLRCCFISDIISTRSSCLVLYLWGRRIPVMIETGESIECIVCPVSRVSSLLRPSSSPGVSKSSSESALLSVLGGTMSQLTPSGQESRREKSHHSPVSRLVSSPVFCLTILIENSHVFRGHTL